MTKPNRKITLFAAAIAALTLGTAGVALAKGGGKGPKAEKLERFDKNKDGKLDDAEKQAMKAEHEKMRAERQKQHAEMLAKYDANKDGQLDEKERAKLHADKAAERFQEIDTNDDGSISFEEWEAHAAKMHAERGRGGRGHGPPHGPRGPKSKVQPAGSFTGTPLPMR